ncbi:MAG: hypothetical protein KDI32_12470 [Pseudomonadales bacterium]|jgi:glycerophosphoryl diester phosphodiesterase|nr:hypothetical protein [Pseudomonadales bacterium]
MNALPVAGLPTLVSYGGNALEYPENSLPAMSSALSLGAQHLAIDLQLSADSVPVVIRDPGLLRTAGIDRSVLDLNAKSLTSLSIGEPRRFGTVFESATLPRLIDVLELLRKYPTVQLLLELQRASIARFGAEHVVDTVLATVKSFRERVIILSTDLPAIYRARNRHGVPIGWRVEALDTHVQLKIQALAPERMVCDYRALPKSGRPTRGPWQWIALGIDRPSDLQRLAGSGVSYFATPAPGRFRELLQPD